MAIKQAFIFLGPLIDSNFYVFQHFSGFLLSFMSVSTVIFGQENCHFTVLITSNVKTVIRTSGSSNILTEIEKVGYDAEKYDESLDYILRDIDVNITIFTRICIFSVV